MRLLLDIGVAVLSLVPMILAFYVPALTGTAIWREGGPGYRVQAGLCFFVGFGLLLFLYLVFTSSSALQVLGTLGLSAVQMSVALLLAWLTVYKLAD